MPSPKKTVSYSTAKPTLRPVIVWTKEKLVLFGYTDDTSNETVKLKGARMAIRWGTTRGLAELSETGPTSSSRISARADLEVRNVFYVAEVTEESVAKWEAFL